MDVPLLEHSPPVRPLLWQPIECHTLFVEVTKHAPEAHITVHFLEFQSEYSCTEFYTDASKSHVGVSYVAVGPSFSESNLFILFINTVNRKAVTGWMQTIQLGKCTEPQVQTLYKLESTNQKPTTIIMSCFQKQLSLRLRPMHYCRAWNM